MIKIENAIVYNTARAVYSARNAMNSWSLSDSDLEHDILGENDLALAMKLVKAGSDHRKFLRQIFVTADITAPLYWWKEADQYKISTVTNSCSTMHKITAKEFTLDDFSYEKLGDSALENLISTITCLNQNRVAYNTWKQTYGRDRNFYWWQIIQLLPSSYNQKRTWTGNYEVLMNQYHARTDHKLDEWRAYCDWIESFPYSELIIGGRE